VLYCCGPCCPASTTADILFVFVQYGIIAGGLADGSICLWNPAPLIEGSGQNPQLTKMQKHTGAVGLIPAASAGRGGFVSAAASHSFRGLQVNGLEFNSFSPNLLASGAADGELCIWDVSNPAQPSLYPAIKVGGVHTGCAWFLCGLNSHGVPWRTLVIAHMSTPSPLQQLLHTDSPPSMLLQAHTYMVWDMPALLGLMRSASSEREPNWDAVVSETRLCGPPPPWYCVQGPAPGPASEITCVAWNKKVQHILASTQVTKQP